MHDILDQWAKCVGDRFDLHLARFDLGEVKEIVEKAKQGPRVALDLVQVVVLPLILGMALG